jgi:hypothetical protein
MYLLAVSNGAASGRGGAAAPGGKVHGVEKAGGKVNTLLSPKKSGFPRSTYFK